MRLVSDPYPAAIVQTAEADAEYRELEHRIDFADEFTILGRWECGRMLLAERIANGGKQVPNGRLKELSKSTGKSQRELRYRMQFAEVYATRAEVGNALQTLGSWREIAANLGASKAKADYQRRQSEWDAEANTAGALHDVRLGDFRDVLADIPSGTVDAIITDPPYPDEFLPLWGELATFAARVLRPGAPLIAWSGQYRLPQVLTYLTGPLTYQWTYHLDLPGSNSRFRTTNMIQTWKPVIVCTNGSWGPHPWAKDTVVSPKKDQELYDWQQNPDPAGELIERYVPASGLVVDPFAGVGSFGVAAVSAGRRFIGAELDEGRHSESTMRLAEMGGSDGD